MGILDQFALSLQPKQKPSDLMREAEDRLVSGVSKMSDIMYRRSLMARADVDLEKAKAEYEDYKANRDLKRQMEQISLFGGLVDQALANNDPHEALAHFRILNPDVPEDAQPAVLNFDGMEVFGWESPSTGERGQLGTGTQASILDYKNKMRLNERNHLQAMELAGAKKASSQKALATESLTTRDLQLVETMLRTAQVEDKTLGGSIGSNTEALKNLLPEEQYAVMRQDIATRINAVKAEMKALGLPADEAQIGRSLIDAAQSALTNDGGWMGNNVNYDPAAASEAMDVAADIIVLQPRIKQLRAAAKKAGKDTSNMTDRDLAQLIRLQEAKAKQ